MPLFVEKGVRKIRKYTINLNYMRGWNNLLYNDLKIIYTNLAVREIESKPIFRANEVELTYYLFRKDKKLCDVNNILAAHDKFFQDAFVWCGCIPDDNFKHVKNTSFRFGGVDKENPRVNIVVTSIN